MAVFNGAVAEEFMLRGYRGAGADLAGSRIATMD
jgi:hypothetical protein